MSDQGVITENGFKKLHVAETVAFAIENIPTVNKETLEKFLQLVHTTGTAGCITPEQIVNKMRLTMKYIPNACPYSLMVLAELLELKTPALSKHASHLSPHRLNGSQTTSPTTNRRPAITVTR